MPLSTVVPAKSKHRVSCVLTLSCNVRLATVIREKSVYLFHQENLLLANGALYFSERTQETGSAIILTINRTPMVFKQSLLQFKKNLKAIDWQIQVNSSMGI